MKTLYLIFAVVGAVVPYIFFVQHFSSEGFGLVGFVKALFANPSASGFTADLLITSSIFWIFMVEQHKGGRGPGPVIFVVLNLLIGLSCAFPAYLYARERQQPVA
ncbi:MAG: hypothetical protein BMS9Abin37_3036 [Acidobacteriota bacterium]|nr:MAG: hypothetical protein BMS9Abin37_3036 [Acidobacteriota bacterium]